MQTEMAFYAVNGAVSGVLDVAGLGSEAEAVRASVDAGEVASLLRRVAEEANGRWAPVVQEVCFWAEAVVWAAWTEDPSFEECKRRLEKAIAEGYALMTLH